MERYEIPEEELKIEGMHGYKSLPEVSEGSKQYLYLHGFCSSCDHLIARKLAKLQFDRGNSFYRMSFRGSGESEGGLSTMTLSTQAEDVKNMVDYIIYHDERESIIPICYSMWASSLLASLHQYPEIQKYFERYYFLAPSFDFLDNRTRNGWVDFLKVWKEEWYKKVFNDARGIYETMPYSFVEDAQQYDMKKSFRSLKGPINVVHGDEDTVVPFDFTKEFIALTKKKVKLHRVHDRHWLIKTWSEVEEFILEE